MQGADGAICFYRVGCKIMERTPRIRLIHVLLGLASYAVVVRDEKRIKRRIYVQ